MWAAWSVLTVALASAAMSLPATTTNSWIAYADAPPLARWDAVWYRSIAVNGYRYDPAVRENNVGFYPLYAVLAAGASRALHTPLLPTGIALSLLFLGAALLLVADLFAEWGGPAAALFGVAALLLYPTAFFFAAFYTESLFLLLVAAALWGARRGHWGLAAAAGFAASLTRFNGFLLAPALAAHALRLPRAGGPASRTAPLAAAAATLAGAAVYPLYLWRRWGDPLLYVHSKAAGWAQHPSPVWVLARDSWRAVLWHVRAPGSGGKIMLFLEVFSTILFLVLTVAVFRRGLLPEGVYVAGTLALLLFSGTLDGIHRYVLVLFPCFLPLAGVLRARPALGFAYVVFGEGLGMVELHRFVHWIHVG